MIGVGSAIAAETILGMLLAALWSVQRRTRAAISLGLSAGFVVGMFALSHVARGEVARMQQQSPNGASLDVVLTPTAANPLCWSALTIERNAGADTYTLGRGRVALFSGGKPRGECAPDGRRRRRSISRRCESSAMTTVAWPRGFSSAAHR